MTKHNRFSIPQDIQSKVDEIMARNRGIFAGWKMEAEGDGGEAAAGDGGDSGDGESGDDAAAALGDAGKQALDRMKADRKAAEARAKAAEAELEKLRNASKTEQEKAVDAARKEGATEAAQRANERLVRSEAKALAATAKFRDPSDAIAQLASDLKGIAVDDDGEVDEKALKALIDGLAKAKPYLLESAPTASAAEAGIGTTGSTSKPDPGVGVDRMRAAYAASSTK